MKAYLAWVVVTVVLLGCGAQELQPAGGAHDAGRDLSRPVIDATERNLADAGCPPEGKIACLPLYCGGPIPEPQCIRGGWSCESLALVDPLTCQCGPVPFGCTCDSSSGVISCPLDGGTDATTTSGAADAGTRCPPLVGDGGYHLACGCASDSTPSPTCLGGAWTCPLQTGGPSVCPPVSKCHGPTAAVRLLL